MANEAYIYSTGPVYVYARIPAVGVGPYKAINKLSGTIIFLGTDESFIEPTFEQKWKPIMSSIGGDMKAFDKMFMGEDGLVPINLNRFNLSLARLLLASPFLGRDNVANGATTRLGRGAMALANGLTYEIWLAFAFYGTLNAAAYPDLPPGYYFPACITAGSYPKTLGISDKKMMLAIEPLDAWNVVDKAFNKYSQDPAYFQNLPSPR